MFIKRDLIVKALLISCITLSVLLVGCKEETQMTTQEHKAQETKVENKLSASTNQPKPKVKQQASKKSKSLKNIKKKLTKYQCDEKWKNKDGVCEVPNPDFHPEKK